MDDKTNLMSPRPLGAGTHIGWYKIREVVGMGGLGITYRANDSKIDREVVIREYLPTAYAVRQVNYSVKPITGDHEQPYAQGLANFLTVAKTLEKFSHDNIVEVHNVIETNNTVYMVMECEYGVSLDSIIQQCGTFEQNHQTQIFFPIFKGLQKIHKLGFVHRSIKPSNIRIRENGSPVLLDFGSARLVSLRQPIESTALVNQDYMPLEQFSSDYGKQGAWTDIYSLAAIMYQGVTGEKPDEALSRSDHLLRSQPDTVKELLAEAHPTYEQSFLSALHAGLTLQPQSRPQSLGRWQLLFKGDSGANTGQSQSATNAPMNDRFKTASVNTSTPIQAAASNPNEDSLNQPVIEPTDAATDQMYDELDISLGPSATEDVDDEYLTAGVLATKQPEKRKGGLLSVIAGCAVVACLAALLGYMYQKNLGTNPESIDSVASTSADTMETNDTTDAEATDTATDTTESNDTTDATATDTENDTTETDDTTDAAATDTENDTTETDDTTDAAAADSENDTTETDDTTDAAATDSETDTKETDDTTDAAATDTETDTTETDDTTDAAATDAATDTTETDDTTDAAATDTSVDAAASATNTSEPSADQTNEVVAKLNEPATATLTTVYFDKPVPNDTQSAEPRTILEIADSVATFSPVDGLDDEFWKDKGCSDCHVWTRENLCTQGEFYNTRADSKDDGDKSEDSKVTRIQHPFGGYFKLALKNWAGNDCS